MDGPSSEVGYPDTGKGSTCYAIIRPISKKKTYMMIKAQGPRVTANQNRFTFCSGHVDASAMHL